MPDIHSLIAQVKRSRLLSVSEKKNWLAKMENMNEDQLDRLGNILTRAEGLNWKEELPAYRKAAEEAQQKIHSSPLA